VLLILCQLRFDQNTARGCNNGQSVWQSISWAGSSTGSDVREPGNYAPSTQTTSIETSSAGRRTNQAALPSLRSFRRVGEGLHPQIDCDPVLPQLDAGRVDAHLVFWRFWAARSWTLWGMQCVFPPESNLGSVQACAPQHSAQGVREKEVCFTIFFY
jgi:hypothetical protein